MPEPYYSDDLVTLYHGDCQRITEWLGAEVVVSDPPYGTGGEWGYGRRSVHNPQGGTSAGMFIANDADTLARDWLLATWGMRPVLIFSSPRLPEPPGGWSHRLVWDKCEPGMNGGPWRYTHEPIFVRGDGWRRTDNRSFSILRVPSGNGSPEKSDHIHAKPVALMQRLIEPAPLGTIADPFAGSGSTLVAAKYHGRRAVGVEIDERYCEVAAKRLAQDTLFGGVA